MRASTPIASAAGAICPPVAVPGRRVLWVLRRATSRIAAAAAIASPVRPARLQYVGAYSVMLLVGRLVLDLGRLEGRLVMTLVLVGQETNDRTEWLLVVERKAAMPGGVVGSVLGLGEGVDALSAREEPVSRTDARSKQPSPRASTSVVSPAGRSRTRSRRPRTWFRRAWTRGHSSVRDRRCPRRISCVSLDAPLRACKTSRTGRWRRLVRTGSPRTVPRGDMPLMIGLPPKGSREPWQQNDRSDRKRVGTLEVLQAADTAYTGGSRAVTSYHVAPASPEPNTSPVVEPK
jgi:hypothetical protein